MRNKKTFTQAEQAEKFKEMHEREGAFVIPNPWDLGSVRLLTGLGFEALATTSAGFANSLGRVDGKVSLDEVLAHCRSLCTATDLPMSADLENCFADEPKKAAATILAAAQTGLVGGSIEDYTGNPENPIYEIDLAIERVHAAAETAHSLDFPFTLTARAENLLHERRDLDDTIRRLQAFEEAGADVLYAPGLRTLEEVRIVTSALSKPVNVLATLVKGATVAELTEAGAKRISLGGALARAAMTALLRAGQEVRNEGSFGWATGLVSSSEMNRLFNS
jgi:2-methylisocitrate lyase-like PEP mutase family enzyme